MRGWAVAAGLALAACSAELPLPKEEAQQVKEEIRPAETPRVEFDAVNLPVLRPAPELQNEVWLNTDAPLRLADLRGSVVLIDMWTFGCINCQRVIPYLRGWHTQYSDQGLVVIGNHYPEFGFERDLENLKEALIRLDVPYPVAQDNDRQTWGAYGTRYWPTLFLIDKVGNIRYTHIGEGRYQEIEAAIQTLLAEPFPQ